MDSEEDMLDAHDMESGEDDFYSGGTDDYNDSDDGEPDYGFVEEDADDSAMIASHRSQKGYCVLKEEDILRHQMDDIERVSVVLSITEVEASILLRHYHWSVGKVHDEWFADEERVRKTVGILENPVVPLSDDKELAWYCWSSYQKSEWKLHRHECKALSSLDKEKRKLVTPTIRLMVKLYLKRNLQIEKVMPITATDNYSLVEALVSHMSEIDEKQMLLYAQMANLVNLILQFLSIDLKEIAENFSKNKTVYVFETIIRVLGGLLSAHLIASDYATESHMDL